MPAFFLHHRDKREIETIGAEIGSGENLCSVACYCYCKADSLSTEVVKVECNLLMKKNKEQLKKEAREFNLKVNVRVNGASHDLSKELIVSRIAFCPSLSAVADEIVIPSRVTIHDKCHLINIIFSDELGEMALHSEESASCAEGDSGLVENNSQFW
jgi:hypothetical protein